MTYWYELRQLRRIQLGLILYMDANTLNIETADKKLLGCMANNNLHGLADKLRLCAEITDLQRRISKIEQMPLNEAQKETTDYYIEINSLINGKDKD